MSLSTKSLKKRKTVKKIQKTQNKRKNTQKKPTQTPKKDNKVKSIKNNKIKYFGQLSNKLEYTIIGSGSKNRTVITLGIKTGSNNDTPKYQGLSHFLEHMLFMGNSQFSSQNKLTKHLEKYGAYLNAYTYNEMTIYYISILSSKVIYALQALSEMIRTSRFDEYNIETEKNVVLNEMRRGYDDPHNELIDTLIEEHLHKSSFRHGVIGSNKTVNAVNRPQLMAYMKTFYKPDNMFLLIYAGGNLIKDLPVIDKYVKQFFEGFYNPFYEIPPEISDYFKYKKANLLFENRMKENEKMNMIIRSTKQLNKGRTGFKFKSLIKKDLSQTYVAIGFTACPLNSNDKNYQKFIKYILTIGMSSELFNNIRDKRGLVYNIKSGDFSFDKTGIFYIKFDTLPEINNVMKVISLILHTCSKLKKIMLTDTEFNNIITRIGNSQIKDGNVIKKVETQTLIDLLFLNTQERKAYIKKIKEKDTSIFNVKQKNIQEYANKIFDIKNCSIITIGPTKYSPHKLFDKHKNI
jgi:predicted Zn-dependent peptidase